MTTHPLTTLVEQLRAQAWRAYAKACQHDARWDNDARIKELGWHGGLMSAADQLEAVARELIGRGT